MHFLKSGTVQHSRPRIKYLTLFLLLLFETLWGNGAGPVFLVCTIMGFCIKCVFDVAVLRIWGDIKHIRLQEEKKTGCVYILFKRQHLYVAMSKSKHTRSTGGWKWPLSVSGPVACLRCFPRLSSQKRCFALSNDRRRSCFLFPLQLIHKWMRLFRHYLTHEANLNLKNLS